MRRARLTDAPHIEIGGRHHGAPPQRPASAGSRAYLDVLSRNLPGLSGSGVFWGCVMTRTIWNATIYATVVAMLLLSITVAWQAVEVMAWGWM